MSDFKHFKYEWFDPYGPFAPLYLINRLRLSFLKELKLKKVKKIIDIGCGAGISTNKLPDYFPSANITGLDASENAIKLAQDYSKIYSLNTNFIHQSALSTIKSKYDLILCFELIEHLDNPEKLIENIAKTISKKGTFVISTLDRSIISYFQNILVAEDILGLIEPGTHDFKKFLRPSEVITMSEQYGFKVKQISGIHIDPVTFEATLSTEQFANYIIAFEKY
ncbi:MAG: bifunctional 2-polyprenyl-6-hydroxyphenol methylase/3-demethylubiquinol 3-O-methyltransferase UbiG [Pseudomonadota bacterium]|nr:bifunctional 2-polyprenyl-6-hydroxyphenol methylase/3-demethylubiquinol 3-O-methyltransferase UbiG [Pseudomonadota bacterium]